MPTFKSAVTSVKQWYRARPVRRAFVWLCVVALLVFIFSNFVNPSNIVFYIGCAILTGAVICSITDTWTDMAAYRATLAQMEKSHKIREMETFGTVTAKSCFSLEDMKDIRRKTRNFRGIIAFKIILIVILIAFLIQSGI